LRNNCNTAFLAVLPDVIPLPDVTQIATMKPIALENAKHTQTFNMMLINILR